MTKENKIRINIIVLLIKRGDNRYLNELHELIGASMKFIALRFMRNEEQANELVQDFWASIHEIIAKMKHTLNAFSFLAMAMEMMASDKLKALGREKGRMPTFVDYKNVNFNSNQELDNLIVKLTVEEEIGKLDEKEKIIIQLIIFENRTIREVARMTGYSKSYVSDIKKGIYRKLQKNLRHLLTDK